MPGPNSGEFWLELHRRLLYRSGRLQLIASGTGPSPNDTIDYLLRCPGEDFLNFDWSEEIVGHSGFWQLPK